MLVKHVILIIFLLSGLKNSAQLQNIEKSGDMLQIILPCLALSSSFIYKNNDNGVSQCLKTIGTTFIITHITKRTVNKERPKGGDFSFPSGHTSAAFSGAAFIEKKYGKKVGVPAYLLASYVGWSRIKTKHHDSWDVLAGAALGITTAYFFTTPINNTNVVITGLDQKPALRITFMF